MESNKARPPSGHHCAAVQRQGDVSRHILLFRLLCLARSEIEDVSGDHSRVPAITARRAGSGRRVRAHTCQAIRRDPGILQRRLQTQLDELILQPFEHAALTEAGSMRQHQMVIIIDGLDECNRVEDDDVPASDGSRKRRRTKEDEQIEVLSAILHAAQDPSFPFAIVIASRPELSIREFFRNTSAAQATRELFLDEEYDPGSDIRLFHYQVLVHPAPI